jgi:hypothetical protein
MDERVARLSPIAQGLKVLNLQGETIGWGAAMLVDVLVGENPTGGTCPVATVVISANGASDPSVEARK